MPPGNTGGLGAVPLYLLFLVLPGLAFVKALIFVERKYDTLGRWDKLGYVLLGGVLSALPLLTLFRIATKAPKIRGENIGSVTVLAMLVGVSLQSVIASVMGIGFGILRYRCGEKVSRKLKDIVKRLSGEKGRKFNDREEPWDFVIDNIREQEVKVVLEDEDEIVGYVARFSSTPERRTLVLSPVEPETQDEIGPGNTDTNAIYIQDADISHIVFRDEEADDEYGRFLPEGDVEPPEDDVKLSEDDGGVTSPNNKSSE